MSSLHQWIEDIWWQGNVPPVWLRMFEPVYAAINRRNLDRRAGRSIRPKLPLISAGNITAGGSGKTPFVIWLAGQLKDAAYAPVILCRGDGGTLSAPRQIEPDDDPALVGDEALLLTQQCGCPVIAGQDRVQASEMAAALGNILILDDGFQYRQLQRACDIVLVPAEGVGNGHQIPAGPLREPVSELARADIIIRTGPAHAVPLTTSREWQWQAEPGSLHDVMCTGAGLPEKVFAATGIARSQRFFADLESIGLDIAATRTFADHHRFTASDVEELTAPGHQVAVTGKDAVKLTALWPAGIPLWVLPQHGHGEAGLFDAVLTCTQERLQGR